MRLVERQQTILGSKTLKSFIYYSNFFISAFKPGSYNLSSSQIHAQSKDQKQFINTLNVNDTNIKTLTVMPFKCFHV